MSKNNQHTFMSDFVNKLTPFMILRRYIHKNASAIAVVFVVTAATKSSENLQKVLEQSSQETNSLNK